MLSQANLTPEWLQGFLTSDMAYLVFLAICLLEGLMLLRFMPTELVVPSALFFIGSQPVNIALILLIAIVGTTVGQVVLFAVARRGGRDYVLQSRLVPVSEDRLDRFDGWFDRWGKYAVPISNTMLFVRGLLTVPAGLSDMDTSTFAVLSAVGSASFQTILAVLYLTVEQTLVIQ